MADIFTEIEAGATYADVKDILVGMAEAWDGPGAADAVATWGDMRTLLNAAATGAELSTISNAEIGSSVRTKLNALRENLIVPSLFADGTDGFYFDFSKTDRLFQDNLGTLANAGGSSIFLGLESHAWAGKTLAEYLVASTPALVEPFDSSAPWTLQADLAISGGKLTCTAAGGTRGGYRPVSLTPGLYRVTFDVDSISGNVAVEICNDANGTNGTGVFAQVTTGTKTQYIQVTNQTGVRFRFQVGTTAQVDSLRIDRIADNHGVQATTAAQPKWQTGGLARFDGSDDCLPTPLVPGSAMTLMAKCAFSVNNSKIIMGCQDASSGRCQLIFSSLQSLSAGVGSQDSATIFASTDISNSTHVVALTFNGSTVKLYVDGVEEYSGAQSGSPSASVPITVGARNVAGTNGGFFDKDIYHALAIKKALTAAEIAAITNLWGTS
jgi:hypothetical protein